MDDVFALSQQSGLGVALILRAYRGGLEPVIFGFAVFTEMKCPPGLVDLNLLQRWFLEGKLSEDEIDMLIAELIKDQIEEHLASIFEVVGQNPPNRPCGTGFDDN